MEFLSEKFALKSPPSKNSDFYMGTGGALEHVMETLDNESFYGKATAGKCVQAFGPLPRAEHHVRLDRTSPCQDSSVDFNRLFGKTGTTNITYKNFLASWLHFGGVKCFRLS